MFPKLFFELLFCVSHSFKHRAKVSFVLQNLFEANSSNFVLLICGAVSNLQTSLEHEQCV